MNLAGVIAEATGIDDSGGLWAATVGVIEFAEAESIFFRIAGSL